MFTGVNVSNDEHYMNYNFYECNKNKVCPIYIKCANELELEVCGVSG